MTKTLAHSHSRITNYTQCPLSYKLLYVDKVGGDESGALQIGSAAHDFFEKYHKSLLYRAIHKEPGIMPEADIVNLAATCFQKEPRDQANFADYLEICRTFVLNYKLDLAWESQAEVQLAFDRGWKPCSWMNPNVMFRAKIDRLDIQRNEASEVIKVRVTDYKTGYGGSVDPFQLDLYAFCISKIHPKVTEVEVVFYYVNSGFQTVKHLEVKDMGVVQVQLEALMSRIEADGRFKAKPGSRCQNCFVAHACTEKASDLVQIDTQTTAEKLGAEIALLDAQSKAKKSTLKAWVSEHGEVHAEGLVYGFFPEEHMNLGILPFLSFCAANQLDPSDYLNGDTTKIKALCRKHPEIANEVAAMVTMDVTQKFKGKKEKGEK